MTSVQINISDLFTLSCGQSQNKTNLNCQRLGEFLKTHRIMQDYCSKDFSWMMVVNTCLYTREFFSQMQKYRMTYMLKCTSPELLIHEYSRSERVGKHKTPQACWSLLRTFLQSQTYGIAWISKRVLPLTEEEALSLSAFYYYFALFFIAVVVSTHLCVVSRCFNWLISLFQGHVRLVWILHNRASLMCLALFDIFHIKL